MEEVRYQIVLDTRRNVIRSTHTDIFLKFAHSCSVYIYTYRSGIAEGLNDHRQRGRVIFSFRVEPRAMDHRYESALSRGSPGARISHKDRRTKIGGGRTLRPIIRLRNDHKLAEGSRLTPTHPLTCDKRRTATEPSLSPCTTSWVVIVVVPWYQSCF